MLTFQDLPSTSTPINANNLNNNFSELKEYELYQDSTGNANEITLSDSSANYKYLEIYAVSDNYQHSVRVYSPNGTNFAIDMQYSTDNNIINIFTSSFTISTNKITVSTVANKFINASNSVASYGSTPYIKIIRVVGYR